MKHERKRSDGEATRERLLWAAEELLSLEGLPGVTTARLAAAAGIVQSGFYAHFGSVEECMVAVAERIGERVLRPVEKGLATLRARGPSDPELIRAQYQRVFGVLEAEWRFVELVLRYHREPTPLGQVLSGLMARLRRLIVDHLLVIGEGVGLDRRHLPQIGFCADLVVALQLSSLETYVKDRSLEQEMIFEVLTQETLALIARVLEWTLGEGQPPRD